MLTRQHNFRSFKISDRIFRYFKTENGYPTGIKSKTCILAMAGHTYTRLSVRPYPTADVPD